MWCQGESAHCLIEARCSTQYGLPRHDGVHAKVLPPAVSDSAVMQQANAKSRDIISSILEYLSETDGHSHQSAAAAEDGSKQGQQSSGDEGPASPALGIRVSPQHDAAASPAVTVAEGVAAEGSLPRGEEDEPMLGPEACEPEAAGKWHKEAVLHSHCLCLLLL